MHLEENKINNSLDVSKYSLFLLCHDFHESFSLKLRPFQSVLGFSSPFHLKLANLSVFPVGWLRSEQNSCLKVGMGEKSTAPEGKKASSSRWRILWEVKARHEKYVTWRTLSLARKGSDVRQKNRQWIGSNWGGLLLSNLLPRFIFVFLVLWNVNVGIYWSAWLSRKLRCDRRVVTECILWFGKVRSLFS